MLVSVVQRTVRVGAPLLGALAVICAVIAALGANPFTILGQLVGDALGSQYYLSETLMVTAPLVLCGIAAAVPFSARIWNIGGTGQLLVGATSSVLVGLTLGRAIAGPLLAMLCILAGIAAGATWALLAGWIKVSLGGNEVIVTLMLNLIAFNIVDYVVTGPWAQGQAPQTKSIPRGATLGSFWQSGFNEFIVIAVVLALIVAVFLRHTRTGFGVRAVGRNLDAARLAGFRPTKLWLGAFAIGGGAAGLAGALLVVGVHGALLPGINEQYGYDGIAIALIAGLRPVLLLPAGFLFAVIEVGGRGLAAGANVSTAISYVIEGVIVISFLAFRVVRLRS